MTCTFLTFLPAGPWLRRSIVSNTLSGTFFLPCHNPTTWHSQHHREASVVGAAFDMQTDRDGAGPNVDPHAGPMAPLLAMHCQSLRAGKHQYRCSTKNCRTTFDSASNKGYRTCSYCRAAKGNKPSEIRTDDDNTRLQNARWLKKAIAAAVNDDPALLTAFSALQEVPPATSFSSHAAPAPAPAAPAPAAPAAVPRPWPARAAPAPPPFNPQSFPSCTIQPFVGALRPTSTVP